jgi:Predicted glycosyltransferases
MPHEIIVVNNSPEDKKIHTVSEKYSQIKIIETGYNAGFARANNVGIKASSGNIILLLNADTYVTDNSIDSLYYRFSSSGFGACVPQIYFTDGSQQLSAFKVPLGGINTLLPFPIIGSIIKGAGKLFSINIHSAAKNDEIINADWIHGACFMFKKEIINSVGLLDEDFFLYSEEIEWCSRIRKKYKIGLFSKYTIIHLEGKSSNQLFTSGAKGYYDIYSKKGLQLMLSNLVRIRKEFGIVWFLFHLMAYCIEVPMLFIYKIFNKQIQPTAFTKNVFYLVKKMFIIIKNKPYFYKV